MPNQRSTRFNHEPVWYLSRSVTVHPLGGCPMASDPRDGVVDPFAEVFGHPGLYVADGSVTRQRVAGCLRAGDGSHAR